MFFRKFESYFPPTDKAQLVAEFVCRAQFEKLGSKGPVGCERYTDFFEQGRNEWGRKFGFGYKEMVENGFSLPAVRFYADYLHPFQDNESICIQTYCQWTEAAKMNFSYKIYTEKNQIAVQGYTIHAFTDLAGKLMVVRPELAEKFFQKWDDILNESGLRSRDAIM